MQNYIEFKNTNAEFKMIFVEGGIFDMGGESGYDDSLPIHKVKLSDFYIGEFAVTQAVWGYMMGDNKKADTSRFKGANRPVENVSYEDIVNEFLPRLNKITGRPADNEYRLPTEAEWEYSARGGKYGQQYPFEYAGSNKLEEVGWYYENSHNQSQTVGMKTPNLLNLYDISGNVWEWCSDWYSSYKQMKEAYTTDVISDFNNPALASKRVLRSGSWRSYRKFCQSANRNYNTPTYRSRDLGFRLVNSFSMAHKEEVL